MTDTRFSTPLEIKLDASTVTGQFSGYAATWGGPPDSYGDIIAEGAFKRTLREHKAEGQVPAMLWAHDQAEPIGRWTELREDNVGLFVSGKFNLETSRGRDAFSHVKAGDVSGLSIGFLIPFGGSEYGGPGVRVLTEVHLVEVSIVALPANRRARIHVGSKRQLEELLHKTGLAKPAARRVAEGGWPALTSNSIEPDLIKNAVARIERAAQLLRKSS